MRFFGTHWWVSSSLALALPAFGFEDARVLPQGVRSVNIRSIQTEFDEKTNGRGVAAPLAEPLAQQLTFERIAKGEEALKSEKLKAFLASNNFSTADSVGQFTADLNGRINVVAPIISYGVSSRLTVALAAPIYDASTAVAVGFQPNDTAAAFLASLSDPENNQSAEARDAADKLNRAVERLNTKLVDHRYAALEDWHAQGLGDMTLAAKYRFVDSTILGAATTTGVVAPTGRVDDPDNLTDIPFGDGQWDVFGQVAVDEIVAGSLVFNQFAKYTMQLPDHKTMRAATPDEKIEVEYTSARYKLGDKVDGGASIQWKPDFGLVVGGGVTIFRKFGDVYRDLNPETKVVAEERTDQSARNVEGVIGFSSVPLYQRGVFAVPFDLKATYTKQLASENMPVTDLAQVDLSVYF